MDNLTKEQRKKNMQAIKATGSKIETIVCHALWHNNIRFRKNVKDLPGKPDIAIKKYNIVIFLDSCFWHRCPQHFKKPKSNNSYWDEKIERNIARDKEINDYYNTNHWHILRIWEHSLRTKDAQNNTIREILNFVKFYKQK